MARWDPDAGGRLREAALQLYAERGYEQTTVAEIAQRAGVTARTYFRHFADKREVLFAGSADLRAGMVEALVAAPPGVPAIRAVAAALDVAAGLLGRDHAHSRQRQAIIDANAELRERELIKMASISAALSAGLRGRGAGDPEATLAAEAGVVVLRVAFERWIAEPGPADLTRTMRETLERLTAVAGDR